jgi:hypothetical protein
VRGGRGSEPSHPAVGAGEAAGIAKRPIPFGGERTGLRLVSETILLVSRLLHHEPYELRKTWMETDLWQVSVPAVERVCLSHAPHLELLRGVIQSGALVAARDHQVSIDPCSPRPPAAEVATGLA